MLPRLFESDHCVIGAAGELIANGTDLGRLARERETPFFLISEQILVDNYKRLMGSFAGIDDVRAFYSVKTNYETEVLRTWRRLGTGAEVSGELDFHVARLAGFDPRDMVFDGPCKTDAELERAVLDGVRLINMESLDEIARLDAIGRRLDRRVRVGVRLDPMSRRPYYDKMITTYKQKFGFPLATAPQAFAAIRECRNLQLVGLHAHIGSQILAPVLYVEALTAMFQVAADLRRDGFELSEINVGGGFPAQSMRNLRLSRRMLGAKLLERFGRLEKRTPSIEEFGQAIATTYRECAGKHGFRPALAIEPGRCLVNNAGMLVGRVRFLKGDWLFTDISINEVPENLFFTEWRVFFPGKLHSPIVGKKNVSGPTLSTYDTLFFQKEVPDLAPGDPIVIFDTGRYSIPRANQFTRPRSGVFFQEAAGGIRMIRRRETVEDVVRAQIWGTPEPFREPAVPHVAAVRGR